MVMTSPDQSISHGHDSLIQHKNISVVVPLFNKRSCIRRALESALGQTVPCREIVVVDDGSTDGGHMVVEQVDDPRIRLIRQENQGPSAARNRAIEEVHGELVAFLDADDEWKPWFLETISGLRTKHSEAGAYATAYEIRESWGHVHVPAYREIPPAPWEGIIPNYFRSCIRCNPMWTSAVAIRREVLDTVGRFVLCPGVGEDAELWARIALRYPIAFSWRIGAVYHREAENRCCEAVFTHVFTTDCFEQAMRDLGVPPQLRPDVEEFLARERLTAAARYVENGQPKVARSILRNCKTHRLYRQKLWWWFWSVIPIKLVSLAWRCRRWFRAVRPRIQKRPAHE